MRPSSRPRSCTPLARPLADALPRAHAERRKAEEQEQLDAFLARQRDKLATPSDAPGEHDEDEDDVDHSFAHLRLGGKGRMRPPPVGLKAKVDTDEDKEELRRMQDEARRMQAVRGASLRPPLSSSSLPACAPD